MNDNKVQIRALMKFWCFLTFYYAVQQILMRIIAENIYPFVDITILVLLNAKQFHYAALGFDILVGPLFKKNKQNIDEVATILQAIFDKNAENFKNKVTDSTNQSKTQIDQEIKGLIGDIAIGALQAPSHPKQPQKQQEQQFKKDE